MRVPLATADEKGYDGDSAALAKTSFTLANLATILFTSVRNEADCVGLS